MSRRKKRRTETRFRPPTDEEIAALEKVYAQVPSTQCKGLCFDSCTSFELSDVERARLLGLGFNIPPRRSVAEIEAEGEATGRVTACPALNSLGLCRVYDQRPLICRAWPVNSPDAPGMSCSYGCATNGSFSLRDLFRARREIEAIGDAPFFVEVPIDG